MAKTGKNIEPFIYFHPGETLSEKMQEMQISEKDFATLSGIDEGTIRLINACKADVDEHTAVALEKATRIPAHFWLKTQENFNIYRMKLLVEQLSKNLRQPIEYNTKCDRIRKTVKRIAKLSACI
jgi:plasmid maintenance system antidote protein VapI